MINAIDFFNTILGKETLKRAIASSSNVYSVCCFKHHTNQNMCFYGTADSSCSRCPFSLSNVSTIQRIRSLWTYVNMHNSQSDDNIMSLANAYLYIILVNLVDDWSFGRDILDYVYNLADFQKTVWLVEVLVDACNEIEEKEAL